VERWPITYFMHLDCTAPWQRVPYLSIAPWQRGELEYLDVVRGDISIGLVWAPRPTGEPAQRRAVPLELLLPLARIPSVRLYSLQYGEAARDIAPCSRGVAGGGRGNGPRRVLVDRPRSGILYYRTGRLDASETAFLEALAWAPSDELRSILCTHMASPVLCRAITRASVGSPDWQRGLTLYRHRFHELARTQAWDLAPEWEGEDLADKHILVHQDQGDGDTLQFCRSSPSSPAAPAE
jgi:hypothetical protein